MVLGSNFSHWGQLRDSFATITEGSNAHWCPRRKNHALRARVWKLLNRMKMYIFFLFCLNIILFLFSTALQKLQKIVTCFPKDKLSYIYPDLQIQKVFTPWLLMHGFSFWSISERLSLSVVLCVKRWISKAYRHCWKVLENQRICGLWRIFLKNSRQFNCSGQTRDSWTTITKQKNKLKN